MDLQKKKINLANLLTITRMVLVLPVIYFLAGNSPRFMLFALILFSIACLTDFLDGAVARMQGMTTKLGTFLDPLADKVLILCVFFYFLVSGQIRGWMFWVILAREAGVTLLRLSKVEKYKPTILAKSKTVIQMCAVIFIIVAKWLWDSQDMHKAIYILMLGVVIITVISGLEYFLVMISTKSKK